MRVVRRFGESATFSAAVLSALLGVLTLGTACSSGVASTPDAGPTSAAGAESVARRGTFQDRLMLTGELQAVQADKIIVPRTPTWQMPIRWMIEDGSVVREGQKVIELDNTPFTGELEQKRLEVDAALNQFNQKRADLGVELADKEFFAEEARIRLEKARLEAAVPAELLPLRDYQEKALEREKAEIGYQKALEEREASRAAADSEVEELRIALERARYDVRTAEDAIARLTLHAPRDGLLIVAQNGDEGRKYQVGDNVHVGLAVMQIPDLAVMQVEAWLSDVDDGRIESGLRARCALDTYPDKTYEGTVTAVSPVAVEQGRESLRRAFRVTIELDEADPERMRPGMSVRAEVQMPAEEDALLVSRAAIDTSRPGGRVRLASGKSVDVKLGRCNARECVVLEGLDDGMRLAVAR